jgi:hypothetical protein
VNPDAQSAGPPELEQPKHNDATAGHGFCSRSHARGSLGWVGLHVTCCRAVETRRARLFLAPQSYSQLIDAARIARCHAGGPRNARLLASPRWAKHIALVSQRADLCLRAAAHACLWLLMAARGFSRLLAASRRLASTRPQIARPDVRIAHASLRVARSRAWSESATRGWPYCFAWVLRWSTCINVTQKTDDLGTSSRRHRGEV